MLNRVVLPTLYDKVLCDFRIQRMKAKPFIKWAGGKGQLLSQLDELLPSELTKRPFTYIEPFVGGGAMLFHMLQKFSNIRKAVINDINFHLVTAYRVVKECPHELIKQLANIEDKYFALNEGESKKAFYLDAREIFNEKQLNDVDRTTYLMFLNRTCFNGLYRENAKGKFNVPFGNNLHPTICNAETIIADSDILNRVNVTILHGDFSATLNHLDEEGINFFYFDPPYRPLNATSSFNSYVKEGFDDSEQVRLRNFSQELDDKLGIYWMMSNSDCSAKNPEDSFFETIYKDFYISRVYASRAINANPTKRGRLTELLISNYLPENFGMNAADGIEPYN